MRVRPSSWSPHARAGETGTVGWASPRSDGGGALCYRVRLDGGPEERYALLYPEEVEPDA